MYVIDLLYFLRKKRFCLLACSPRISLNQIVHVKDEDEILNDTDQKKVMINMAQATEEMLNHEYPQPIILLKRVCLEQ
jgi:hypothetical protein